MTYENYWFLTTLNNISILFKFKIFKNIWFNSFNIFCTWVGMICWHSVALTWTIIYFHAKYVSFCIIYYNKTLNNIYKNYIQRIVSNPISSIYFTAWCWKSYIVSLRLSLPFKMGIIKIKHIWEVSLKKWKINVKVSFWAWYM